MKRRMSRLLCRAPSKKEENYEKISISISPPQDQESDARKLLLDYYHLNFEMKIVQI